MSADPQTFGAKPEDEPGMKKKYKPSKKVTKGGQSFDPVTGATIERNIESLALSPRGGPAPSSGNGDSQQVQALVSPRAKGPTDIPPVPEGSGFFWGRPDSGHNPGRKAAPKGDGGGVYDPVSHTPVASNKSGTAGPAERKKRQQSLTEPVNPLTGEVIPKSEPRKSTRGVVQQEIRENMKYDPVSHSERPSTETRKSTLGQLKKEKQLNNNTSPITGEPLAVQESKEPKHGRLMKEFEAQGAGEHDKTKPERSSGKFRREVEAVNSNVDIMGNPKEREVPKVTSGTMAAHYNQYGKGFDLISHNPVEDNRPAKQSKGQLRHELAKQGAGAVTLGDGQSPASPTGSRAAAGSTLGTYRRELAAQGSNVNPITGVDYEQPKRSTSKGFLGKQQAELGRSSNPII